MLGELYDNKYIFEFEANIVSMEEKDGKFHIVLDRQLFFPGGGGQLADRGTIDSIEIEGMIDEGDKAVLVLGKRPSSDRVNCTIDKKRRLDTMKQHSAQHILSGCFFKLYNSNTCAFHMGEEISTIDFEGRLTEEQVRACEAMANEIIDENIAIRSELIDRSELKSQWTRRPIPVDDDDIRILTIEGHDINACCGVHPDSTGEVGVIAIKKFYKNKSYTRVEFLAGKRAVDFLLNRSAILTSISDELSCGDESVLKAFFNLNNMNDSLRKQSNAYLVELSEFRAMALTDEVNNSGKKYVIYDFSKGDKKASLSLSSLFIELNSDKIFFGHNIEHNNGFVIAVGEEMNVDMKSLLKILREKYDIKGGGGPNNASGIIVSDSIEGIGSVFDEITLI